MTSGCCKPLLQADYYEIKNKANLVLFDKLFVEENFAPALKKYRVLFCLMNRDVLDADQVDEKAMKNTMFALECFFDKFPNVIDKTAHFVKVSLAPLTFLCKNRYSGTVICRNKTPPYWCRNKTLSERPILPFRENFRLFVAFKAIFSYFYL